MPRTGSTNCDPLPLNVTFAPVSPLMYNKLAPPAPIILPLRSNPSGAFSIPTQIFSTDVTGECKLIKGGGALVNLLGLFKELWCSVLMISLIFCIAKSTLCFV